MKVRINDPNANASAREPSKLNLYADIDPDVEYSDTLIINFIPCLQSSPIPLMMWCCPTRWTVKNCVSTIFRGFRRWITAQIIVLLRDIKHVVVSYSVLKLCKHTEWVESITLQSYPLLGSVCYVDKSMSFYQTKRKEQGLPSWSPTLKVFPEAHVV